VIGSTPFFGYPC